MTVDDFIHRWQNATGTEKANYQRFLTELTELLELPRPDPASEETAENSYVFERRDTFRHGDGSESRGFIDLYRRGCFVCEAKQTGKGLETPGWDEAMLRARGQAEAHTHTLPADWRNVETLAQSGRQADWLFRWLSDAHKTWLPVTPVVAIPGRWAENNPRESCLQRQEHQCCSQQNQRACAG